MHARLGDQTSTAAGLPLRRCGRLATAALVLLVVITGCAAGTASSAHSGAGSVPLGIGVTVFAAGQRAPAPFLEGTTLTGERLTVDQSVPQITVLNVWASWCGPCRAEFPMLAAEANRLQRSGVRFVGLDEHDVSAKARAFVAASHSTYPQLLDRDGALLRRLRVLPQMGIPSTLVEDRHGRIAARVIGPASASALHRILDALMAER